MVIIYIILIILFLLSSILFMLCFSNLEIEIKKYNFNSDNKYKKLEDYFVDIKLKLFDKLSWIKIRIDNKKVEKIKESKILENKIFKNLKYYKEIKLHRKEILNKRNLNKLNIKIKKLNLDTDISLIDNIFTSCAVSIIASGISVLLARTNDGIDREKYRYRISPIYKAELSLKVKLNCIIDIKIVHIMSIIFELIKKRRVELYEGRTSNRRTYVFSDD